MIDLILIGSLWLLLWEETIEGWKEGDHLRKQRQRSRREETHHGPQWKQCRFQMIFHNASRNIGWWTGYGTLIWIRILKESCYLDRELTSSEESSGVAGGGHQFFSPVFLINMSLHLEIRCTKWRWAKTFSVFGEIICFCASCDTLLKKVLLSPIPLSPRKYFSVYFHLKF